MVLTKEYRIPLPVSVDEYRIAQVYMVAKMSKEQTGHGEGVEIVENRPYYENETSSPDGAGGEDRKSTGQYTHKIYHIGSRLPSWIKAITPTSALQVVEKAWNAYPYCKTVYNCPFLGKTENAFDLDDKELSERVVDIVDIAFDPIDPTKYKEKEDPTLFASDKTGRGQLQNNWADSAQPIMTCYKYCSVEFRYWGLQTRVENFVHKAGLRDVFLLGHRQAFCWIDEWFGLTMEDVRQYEKKAQDELTTLLASGEHSS